MPVTTFRTMFARGHFRVLGEFRERDSNGLPHLFSLHDAVGLAVAARLMKIAPVTASRAFEIGAIYFAHSSEGPEREPAKAYNFRQSGYTLLAYFPDTDAFRLIAEDREGGMLKLVGHGVPDAVCVCNINNLLARLFEKLGLNPSEALEGSAPLADGSRWMEGEFVG